MKFHKSSNKANFASQIQKIIFTFCILAFLGGCGRITDIADATNNVEPEQASLLLTETSESDDDTTQDNISEYSDADSQKIEELQGKCEEIALMCNDLMVNGERETIQYFPYDKKLSQAAIDDVETLLAKSGYPVINSDSVYPEYLENSDGLQHFFELADNGKEAEQDIITVSVDNSIYYTDFQYADETMYYFTIEIIWDENGEYQLSKPVKMDIMDWGMTYNGFFYYQVYPLNRHWNAYLPIRLQPVNKELYDLYLKYLSLAPYPSCIYTRDWDSQNYENICFNDLFEYFYLEKNGDHVYANDYDYYADMSCSLIPASVFEDTILPYFNISLDEFRTLTLYMSDTNTYPWQEINCFNIIYCPWLTPEVVEKRDNGDGTFTIVVDVICFDYKYFPQFTHEITIKPSNDGGFQYIANHVTYIGKHGVPDTTPRLKKQRESCP